MDDHLRNLCEVLRQFDSQEAANWLIKHYPIDHDNWGEAIYLIAHRSWLKIDQVRLARYYFQKLPFANGKVYEVFASFMSLSLLIQLIKEFLPTEASRLDLLLYYIVPVLNNNIKSDTDKKIVKSFLKELDKGY